MWEQLLAAIAKGEVPATENLINLIRHVDFNKDCSKLFYYQIPLHYAVYLRRESIVDKLLAVRPELLRIVDINGQNALDIAIRIPNNEIIVDKILTVTHKILTYNQMHIAESEGKKLTVKLILATVAAKNSINEVIMNKNATNEYSVQQENILKSVIKDIDKTKSLLEGGFNPEAISISSKKCSNSAFIIKETGELFDMQLTGNDKYNAQESDI